MAQYVDLFNIVKEMCAYNDLGIRSMEQWPDLSPEFDINQLNLQARRISGDDLFLFLDGEQRECLRIVKKYDVEELHEFLNQVFDGYLHDKITI